MKIVFMGTPDFAVGALEALIAKGEEITLVVTQPDRPKGRSKELVYSPVKECALKHNIPVFQPTRIKTPENVEELRKYEADVFVVAAFGQILSKEILEMPPMGCINIHASLLPKYRGASPIQSVILDGEEETGITIMQMNEGVDTGDILYQKSIPILREDTFETLHDKLMVLGGEAITEAIDLLCDGVLEPVQQEEEKSSHVKMITKEMGELHFEKAAIVLERQVHGMNPWPSAYSFYHGKQVKIWDAIAQPEEKKQKLQPGYVVNVSKDSFSIQTADGVLEVKELQLEGKKRMSTHDFLLGVKVTEGEVFGRE